MTGIKVRKWWQKFVVGFLLVVLLLSIVPYFVPLAPPGEPSQLRDFFPESRFASFSGIDLHYRLWEPVDNMRGKVLLVHGLGGSTFSWRYNVQSLVDAGYLVLAVDLPGFGYSSRQRGINHSQEARGQIVWELLEEAETLLGEKESAINWDLVGHSMGGGTIAAMALENPSRVNSLTFVAGALYNQPRGLSSFLLRFPPLGRWLEVAAAPYFIKQERVKDLLFSAYGEEPAAEDVEGYFLPLSLPGTAGTLIDMTLTSNPLAPERIKTIKAPSLAVWGENDQWVLPEYGSRLVEDIKKARLVVIPEAGHCPMETHPDVFNTLLINFLET